MAIDFFWILIKMDDYEIAKNFLILDAEFDV